MSARSGGGFHQSRDGLFARPSQGEQTQVSIDMGPQFDLDSEVEGLSGQVGKLKHMARAIGQEVHENSQVADSLEETMHRAQMALRRGIKKLNRSLAKGRSNHLLYLALFFVGIFFLVIFWSKLRL